VLVLLVEGLRRLVLQDHAHLVSLGAAERAHDDEGVHVVRVGDRLEAMTGERDQCAAGSWPAGTS
jgi:hypothetical protein